MSSSTFIGNPDVMIAGSPPPPPPPPPVSGQLPTMRINTVENAAKRSQPVSNDAYEPPAAIQNAMLTKDKKPFTYTPGMGGKLDLSQIRSPRMARRVAKNANDEGIEGSPKLATEPKPSQPPAASAVANFLTQPQVAVPVFPTNVPIQPHINKLSQPSPINKPPSNVTDRQVEPSKNIIKVDTKAVPSTTTLNQSNTPESPSTPTQVTLAKAPTPWLQNKNKPQEELPEWVKRASVNKTASSPPSEGAVSPTTIYVQVQQSPPQYSQTKQKQEQEQHLTSQRPSQQCSKPQPSTQQLQQQRQNTDSAASQQTKPIAQSHQHEHVIPIRIEDRPSVFDAKCQSGHHQFKQSPTVHHQQRWGQVQNQSQNRSQDQEHFQPHVAALSRPEQPVGTTYIIPLVVEGSDEKTIPSKSGNNTTGKITRVAQQQWNPGANQQHEPGPIQSKSFRVLQKITDTDASNDVGTEQIRKMELSEDDRLLMNKFKEQVDQESYLHQEEDPRYRGAAIPSRAFRFLQNMTDSRDTSLTCAAPRNVQNVPNKRQNRNSKVFEETQANLPPSEQQVQEPKKYMGSAIPSRSFRILQAMTAPESITTQENHQADYSHQTENYLPGNQQGIFLLSRPVSFWCPEGWPGCYPIHYNIPPNELETKMNKHSFPFYLQPDGSAHNEYASFYPVYDKSFAENVAPIKVMRLENFPSQCGYAAVICPQTNYNGVERAHVVDANSRNYADCRFSTADSSLAANDKHLVRNGSTDNGTRNTVLPDEINHLDAQSNGTHNLRNANENCNSHKNCIITAMNIVDKENGTFDSSDSAAISNNIEMPEKTFGLRVNIPNYTYIDASDSSTCSNSSDSSDFGDSTSDNEDLSDSCRKKKCNRDNGTTSDNTSSDSDSDSYVAYSTNLNPCEKSKRELSRIASADNATALECSTDHSEHSRNISKSGAQSEKVYSKENYFDYSDDRSSCPAFEQDATGIATRMYSDDGDRTDDRGDFNSCPNSNQDTTSSGNCELNIKYRDQECPVIDNTVSHQPGIIHNDTERPDSESTYCESTRNIDERNEAFSGEATSDDSSDDAGTTMVSVSLPLKFKFFVSEDNEDVTTVIIGNSKINAERACSAKDGHSAKDNKVEDVSVNFRIGNDTSVDFTMKEDISDATRATTTSVKGKAVNIEPVIPRVDFTLKRDPVRISETSCERQNSMEFTVGKAEHDEINCTEPASKSDVDDHTASQSVTVTQDVLRSNEIRDNVQAEFICNNFENIHSDKAIKAEVATFERCETRNDFISGPQVQIQLVDADKMERENYTIVNDDTELGCQAKLGVQDSRENTDDEDSGVTSDLSRIISEVDTDSECTSSKHLRKYQRTQTHSRLFRLLNDDSVPSETDSSFRKKYLSLPLNTDANCDDSYCSSSGLTSPEYSPIHEQSLGKCYSTINGSIVGLPSMKVDQPEQIPPKEDPYFRFWKNPNSPDAHKHDAVPSLAFKILDSKIPSWAYKANVLCPRIKSTKSVPQTLSTMRKMSEIRKPSSPSTNLPIPTSYANSC